MMKLTGLGVDRCLGGEGKHLHLPQENDFSSSCFCVPSTEVHVGTCILRSQAELP